MVSPRGSRQCARVLLGCILSAALATGCGPQSATRQATTKRITWLVRSDLGQGSALWAKQTAAEFAKTHPGVRVSIVSVPSAQYNEKFLTMYAAGTPPDVVGTYAMGFGTFYARHMLANISPELHALNLHLAKYFPPSVLATMTRGGKVYGLPFSDPPMVILYNRTLFHTSKLPYPPTSWSDRAWTIGAVLRDARVLTKLGPSSAAARYGLIMGPQQLGYTAWLWGADIFSPAGPRYASPYQTGVPSQPHVDGARFLRAMTWLADLITKWRVSPTADQAAALGVLGNPILSGRVAMEDTLITSLHVFARAHPAFRWGIAPIPYGPAGDLSPTGVSGWAVSAKSPHPKTAAAFVAYITMGPAAATYAKIGGFVPADQQDLPTYLHTLAHLPGNGQTYSEDQKVVTGGIAASDGYIFPAKVFSGGPHWNTEFVNVTANVWNGIESPPKAFAALQRSLAVLLRQEQAAGQ